MSKLNISKIKAVSVDQNKENEKQLERLVLTCMLWEKEDINYEGKSRSELISDLVKKVDPKFVVNLAKITRSEYGLRHVPLFLMRQLASIQKLKAQDLADVIQRADEMAEFLSIYWKDGKTPIAHQVKKGLAMCFSKFSEHQLAKYNSNSAAIKLRDVMFLVRPKPVDAAQAELFTRIADNKLATPDTWEVALSGGADKRETFTRLMKEGKLGASAFLRNLRNMYEAGVHVSDIVAYSARVNASKVPPSQFISAKKNVPQYQGMIYSMLQDSLENKPKFSGTTLVVVDTSGSMNSKLSLKSQSTRGDTAAVLAMIIANTSEYVDIYATAGDDRKRQHATARIGTLDKSFALADSLAYSQTYPKIGGGGIFLVQVMKYLEHTTKKRYDRVIVITDEIDCDDKNKSSNALTLGRHNYILNVGTEEAGIKTDGWVTITGYSSAVLDYIRAFESNQ